VNKSFPNPYHELKLPFLGICYPTPPFPVIYTADNRIRLFNTPANYGAHEGRAPMEWGWENESEQFIGPEMEGKPAGWE